MAKTTKKVAAKSEKTAATTEKKTVAKKKVAAKKTTAKKAATKKTTASKKSTAKKAPVRPSAVPRQISAGERHRLIAEAAYLRGEAQGFLSDDREDWLAAEAEIDARLGKAGIRVRE